MDGLHWHSVSRVRRVHAQQQHIHQQRQLCQVSCVWQHRWTCRNSLHVPPRHNSHSLRSARSRCVPAFQPPCRQLTHHCSVHRLSARDALRALMSQVTSASYCKTSSRILFRAPFTISEPYIKDCPPRSSTTCVAAPPPSPLPLPPPPPLCACPQWSSFFFQVPLVALQFAANSMFLSLAPLPPPGQHPSHVTAFVCGGAAGSACSDVAVRGACCVCAAVVYLQQLFFSRLVLLESNVLLPPAHGPALGFAGVCIDTRCRGCCQDADYAAGHRQKALAGSSCAGACVLWSLVRTMHVMHAPSTACVQMFVTHTGV